MPYTPNDQHRNRAFAQQKSQWSIPLVDEVRCFDLALNKTWVSKDYFWGVHISEDVLSPLGTAPPPLSCDVHLAKFVGDLNDNWHGYPVAHWATPYDRPAEALLLSWIGEGLITKTQMARIRRGKKCAL